MKSWRIIVLLFHFSPHYWFFFFQFFFYSPRCRRTVPVEKGEADEEDNTLDDLVCSWFYYIYCGLDSYTEVWGRVDSR
jgi:hypothetical protein